jgi:hypothetical protein
MDAGGCCLQVSNSIEAIAALSPVWASEMTEDQALRSGRMTSAAPLFWLIAAAGRLRVARLSSPELNQAFFDALGDHVVHVDDMRAAALTLELAPPLPRRLRVYLFNATNPSGGRSTPEHKIQLMMPGQGRGERGNFDFSEERSVVLAGKVEDQDIFVLWDASLYRDFAAFRNVQVRTETIHEAQTTRAIATQSRRTRLGDETVIVAPSALLADAITLRLLASAPTTPAPAPTAPALAVAATGGMMYTSPLRPDLDTQRETRVFEVDPNLIDRGTTAHMDVQDGLAEALRNHGLQPLSPKPGDPQFDIAWIQDGVAFVTEVKSLTDANEEGQLRLGLGQVLSYVHLLNWPGVQAVRGVLSVERRPTADYWTTLCAEHDVVLTWPEAYDDLFADAP